MKHVFVWNFGCVLLFWEGYERLKEILVHWAYGVQIWRSLGACDEERFTAKLDSYSWHKFLILEMKQYETLDYTKKGKREFFHTVAV